jgi:TIR domain
MPLRPKVFISYVSADRGLATQLRADLETAGADPWQFDHSAIPGTDAWDVILNRISQSDYFVVLLSPQALESQAVREEIDHAHYSRINSPQRRPVPIPLILDDSISVPPKLVRAVRMAYRPSAHLTVVAGLASAMGLTSGPFLFANASEPELTLTAEHELDVPKEVEAFFVSLIERNSTISKQYQALITPTAEMAAGRLNKPHERFYKREILVVEWFTPDASWRFRDTGGQRDAETIYIVREPLVFGVHRGYMIETNVVAQIHAILHEDYVETSEATFSISKSRLTLRFEGFLGSIPSTDPNGWINKKYGEITTHLSADTKAAPDVGEAT